MTTLVFDEATPRRPGLNDVGGGAWEDDVEAPPDPTTMPSADPLNQLQLLAVAYGKLAPACAVHVVFVAGAPTISSVIALRTTLTADDFTLTDHGSGDTSVVADADKLPPATWPPFAVQVDDTEIDRVRAVGVSNGARVKTKLGATGTDAAFLLFLSGV